LVKCKQSTVAAIRGRVAGSRLPATSSLLEVFMDPSPDYDASDEIEYFFNFVPWGLRGVYPPPAYPPV